VCSKPHCKSEMPPETRSRKRRSEHWKALLTRSWTCQDCEKQSRFAAVVFF
jgi:hypothetical protein